MYAKWCAVLDAVPNREEQFAVEMQKQQQNEELRIVFAEKANAAGAYIEEKHTELSDLIMQGGATMEVRMAPNCQLTSGTNASLLSLRSNWRQ